jgi:class 3 adenylate cyclase/predicted ATPase
LVQRIEEWLGDLGLGEYAAGFAENKIDFSILPDLTDQDLKELGITALGDRRKLLRAIAALSTETITSSTNVSKPAAISGESEQRVTASEATGERRYLTVLFCDLVDSTGIASRLDAEEWRDLVGAYLEAASGAVVEMGGTVAKKLGDGLMALFGYPTAHENDAERAARAALAIHRALTELNRSNAASYKPELAARIGIETGPVVVDAAGEIFGDVPNVASRVQALADPGSVMITAQVQRQIAGLFVAEERGAHDLKGLTEPVTLFRLVRASGGGRQSSQRMPTPLVGREDEIVMLMRRWERARQGDGQLVLIVGEPGLGKSRLIDEFHSRLRDTPHTWLEWSSSQLLQNTPLHPVAEWGRQRFGGADVAAERRFADLEGTLAQMKLDPAENAPLLAPLFDIPLPSGHTPSLAPDELRRRQLAALMVSVMASARVQPVVLAIEDLHWTDPTTLDVLRGIAERGALAPLFVVGTARPEFRPPWSMRSHHATISLAPLDRMQVRDMIVELSARHALPREVVDDVAARTGGVPLFVEEVTRLLLERNDQGGIHVIPPSLQQSLMARLDRLGPFREVAQVGSVIGRGFSYVLLRALTGMAEPALQAALEQLAEADILLVQGLPPDSDYRFKHALIQDAAYENLLKSRRQILHRRVAETLRDLFPGTAAAEPEVLAHHFTQAFVTDAAIEWWGKAGDQALRRSAFQEAISHLGKAIGMADKAGESGSAGAKASASARQRVKLQTDLGQALMLSRGFAADESQAAFIRARELAAAIDDPTERYNIYYGLWVGNISRGDLGLAREIAETFFREAQRGERTAERGSARRLLGTTCFYQGDFTEALANLVEALSTYDAASDREAMVRLGASSATVKAWLAFTKWLLGELEPARVLIEEAVAYAIETRRVATLVAIYHFKAHFEMIRGAPAAARPDAEILVKLSQEKALPHNAALGTLQSAWAKARLESNGSGSTELREALATYIGQGYKQFVPFYQGLLAEVEAQRDAEGALTLVDEALALARQTGEHWSDACLHRLRGEILLRRDPGNPAPAEEAFLTAIAVAQEQKARSFELRAAFELARLYNSMGRSADAHALLAPALQGFAPTPEFSEIEEAQALLAALAETDEVKNAAAARQRRLRLQTRLGQALLMSRGFGADEAKAAFIRARELASAIDNPTERLSIYQGLWNSNLARGELALAREIAETSLREAERGAPMTERVVGHSLVGTSCLWQGDFVEAQINFVEALSIYDPKRDRDTGFRFGLDIGAGASLYLASQSGCWVRSDGCGRSSKEPSLARSKSIM